MKNFLKLSFYVPESHLDLVKNAVFAAGAGRYKNYDSACWVTLGVGQFRPLESSKPFLGEVNQIEKIPEFKVEMICENSCLREVLEALKANHPYEEPAFDYYECRIE